MQKRGSCFRGADISGTSEITPNRAYCGHRKIDALTHGGHVGD
jgi:hypothetical protein